jgi:hypothetical protein
LRFFCGASFKDWCLAVGIQSYFFEFSKRKYFLLGEFYAKADEKTIKKLIELHGENWRNYYKHHAEVEGFLEPKKELRNNMAPTYMPQNDKVKNFFNTLRK